MRRRRLRPTTAAEAVAIGRFSPILGSATKPRGKAGMDRDDFDEMLRTSPFFAQSMFDLMEGMSIPLLSLIELLVAKHVVTMDEIILMLETDAEAYSGRNEMDFTRLAIDAFLRDVRQFSPDGVALVRKQLWQRRQRARKAAPRRQP